MYSQLGPGGGRLTPQEATELAAAAAARTRPESLSRGHSEQDQGAERTNREVLFDILERPESSCTAKATHYFLTIMILVSTTAVIVETMPQFHMDPLFFAGEMFVTAIFTIEFAMRLYTCSSLREFTGNCFNVIDFIATFPGYVELLLVMSYATASVASGEQHEAEHPRHMQHLHKAASSLRMIRIVRLARVFRVMRIAKVARHSRLLSTIFAVFIKVSKSGLVMMLILMGFAMVLSASLVYLFESELCEESGVHCAGPSAFVSIPSSFWWAISTLTTVGYGDMVPHTVAGKIMGAATAIAGVFVVAIGISLVSINFRECFIEEQARQERARRWGYKEQPESWPREEAEEIQALLRDFDTRSTLLLAKLRALAVRQDDGAHPTMMVDVLTSHTTVLASDVKVFIQQVLSPAGTGASCTSTAAHE